MAKNQWHKKGLACPKCKKTESIVAATRAYDIVNDSCYVLQTPHRYPDVCMVRRERRCKACTYVWFTYEGEISAIAKFTQELQRRT